MIHHLFAELARVVELMIEQAVDDVRRFGGSVETNRGPIFTTNANALRPGMTLTAPDGSKVEIR